MTITEKRILDVLRLERRPLKARQIASILRGETGEEVSRTDANRLLYSMKIRGLVLVDDNHFWKLSAEARYDTSNNRPGAWARREEKVEPTYYDVLQVSPQALPQVIERAYKTLASIYHPDRATSENRTECEEHMKRINVAYEVLSDTHKRKEYDDKLGLYQR